MTPETLAERVERGQRLELGDELSVAAESELEDDPPLVRRSAELVQARDVAAKRRLFREVVEGRTAPELVGLSIEENGCGRIAHRACPRLSDERLEAVDVDLGGVGVEQVPARPVL